MTETTEIIINDRRKTYDYHIDNFRFDSQYLGYTLYMTHNYWSFDILLKKIQNKAEEFGIAIKLETEEYTSRTCPICYDNSKNNCQDRIFHCTFCGYTDHRDIIGARNIMLKSMYGSMESIHWCETAPFGVSV